MTKNLLTVAALAAVLTVPAAAGADVYVGGSVGGAVQVRFGRSAPPPPPVQVQVPAVPAVQVYGHAEGGFSQPPPPPAPCPQYCGAPPPVSQSPYYAPAPPPQVTYQQPRPRRLPVFGLGVFVGGSELRDSNNYGLDRTAATVGGIMRLRIGRRVYLEGEMAHTEIEQTNRVDFRMGTALIVGLNPHGWVNPYLLGGGGFGMSRIGSSDGVANVYGELGGGLELKLTRHFRLAADARGGALRRGENDNMVTYRSAVVPVLPQDETYLSGRLTGIVYF